MRWPQILRRRVLASRPSGRECLIGAPLWAAAMAASAAIGLRWRLDGETGHWLMLMAVYIAGGLLAWPVALWLMRALAMGRSTETRLAAAFVCLTVGTLAITALAYALLYYGVFAQWHGDLFSALWAMQLTITIISAVYQFAVLGLGLYLPLGLPAAVAASVWLAGRMR